MFESNFATSNLGHTDFFLDTRLGLIPLIVLSIDYPIRIILSIIHTIISNYIYINGIVHCHPIMVGLIYITPLIKPYFHPINMLGY